jgi:hypothetical protein
MAAKSSYAQGLGVIGQAAKLESAGSKGEKHMETRTKIKAVLSVQGHNTTKGKHVLVSRNHGNNQGGTGSAQNLWERLFGALFSLLARLMARRA